jgi:hypothetical protein
VGRLVLLKGKKQQRKASPLLIFTSFCTMVVLAPFAHCSDSIVRLVSDFLLDNLWVADPGW